MITFVLENTYVTFAGFIFKQVSGIPMGGNASPLLADLTLSVLEFKFLNSNLHFRESKLLNYMTRFIDDLFSVNAPTFMELCKQIYPASLPLERTNNEPETCDYLDFTAKLANGRLELSLYDKTKAFPFGVIKITDVTSNIHSRIAYNNFYSQLICTGRLCNNFSSFKHQVLQLFSCFVHCGFNKVILVKTFKKFGKMYSTLLLHFGLYNKEVIKKFIKDYV